MNYSGKSTSFVGQKWGEMLDGTGEKPEVEYSDNVFSHLKLTDNSPIIVGEMDSRNGS